MLMIGAVGPSIGRVRFAMMAGERTRGSLNPLQPLLEYVSSPESYTLSM
jgi:hypothetical protein